MSDGILYYTLKAKLLWMYRKFFFMWKFNTTSVETKRIQTVSIKMKNDYT